MADLAFGATAMASIFAIVDPLGVVPFFSVLTEDLRAVQKQDIVSKACLTATITLGVFAGILVAVLSAFILLHNAERIFRKIGRTGTRALGRVMGLLLAAIAVQFLIDGIVAAAQMKGLIR